MNIFVEKLYALLIIKDATADLFLAAEALAGGFNDLPQRWSLLLAEV